MNNRRTRGEDHWWLLDIKSYFLDIPLPIKEESCVHRRFLERWHQEDLQLLALTHTGSSSLEISQGPCSMSDFNGCQKRNYKISKKYLSSRTLKVFFFHFIQTLIQNQTKAAIQFQPTIFQTWNNDIYPRISISIFTINISWKRVAIYIYNYIVSIISHKEILLKNTEKCNIWT